MGGKLCKVPLLPPPPPLACLLLPLPPPPLCRGTGGCNTELPPAPPPPAPAPPAVLACQQVCHIIEHVVDGLQPCSSPFWRDVQALHSGTVMGSHAE